MTCVCFSACRGPNDLASEVRSYAISGTTGITVSAGEGGGGGSERGER